MQKLIAAYLFQHKKCALPHIGVLEIKYKEAAPLQGEQKITAPVPEICFSDRVKDDAGFIDYIAASKNISSEEAAYHLNKYCEEINGLPLNGNAEIPGAGVFRKNENDKIIFVPEELPAYFLPDTAAMRVIHADKSHAMLVGDKETNTAAMAEFFIDTAPAKKKRFFLLTALVLILLASAAVVLYLSNDGHNSFFGISHKYEAAPAGNTYQKLP